MPFWKTIWQKNPLKSKNIYMLLPKHSSFRNKINDVRRMQNYMFDGIYYSMVHSKMTIWLMKIQEVAS